MIPRKVKDIVLDALNESDEVQITGNNAKDNIIFRVDDVEYEIIIKKEVK